MSIKSTFPIPMFNAAAFKQRTLFAERDRSLTIVIPSRNEAKTLGHILGVCREFQAAGMADQVISLVNNCTDDGATLAVANSSGVEVVDLGSVAGKGEALFHCLDHVRGDVVAFFDGDSGPEFNEDFLYGVLGPFVADPKMGFVKASYLRPRVLPNGTEIPRREGRVSKGIRPLLAELFPAALGFEQPLAGEFAARTDALREMYFPEAWGVEIATDLQALDMFSPGQVVQVDVGKRYNDHRSDEALVEMAAQVERSIRNHAAIVAGQPPIERVLRRHGGLAK